MHSEFQLFWHVLDTVASSVFYWNTRRGSRVAYNEKVMLLS